MFPSSIALCATNGSTALLNWTITEGYDDTGATSADTPLYERWPRAEDDEGPARGGPGPACGGPPGAGCEADTWLFHWEAYAWLRLADALLGRRHRSSHWAWLFIVRTSQRKTQRAHMSVYM